MIYNIIADDNRQVRLGDEVWVNHCAGFGESPRLAILLGIQSVCEDDNWPYLIEVKTPETKSGVSRYRWAHVYATKEGAIDADPHPTIQKLKAELERLTGLLVEQQR